MEIGSLAIVRGAPSREQAWSGQVAPNAHEEGSIRRQELHGRDLCPGSDQSRRIVELPPNTRRHWGLEFRVNLGEI